MNMFQIVFLDVVLLLFPILVYLIYLSTNKNINNKAKKIYLILTLVTSFFMIYNYGINNPIILPILVLNSIVIFSYLEDKFILANVFAIIIIYLYKNTFNYIYILFISYVFILMLYLIKNKLKLKDYLFVQLSIFINCIVYFIWIKTFNVEYYSVQKMILVIISYIFIVNIICMMYETGKNLLKTHLKFKELQQEKQIILSLFKITHEIKNPIAVCKGYLDMLNVNDSKQVERFVPIIKSEIERLLSLLQDYLLINKNNLDLDIMDLNMMIEDNVKKLQPLLQDNKVNLNLDLVDDEIYVNGDYNRLSQVVINIIKNSVEAISKNKDGIINIKSKLKDNKYFLYFEDNGIGMTKEIINKMKEPFFTTKKRGSGLGVSLIYEIIEAHNAKIEYKSEYGKGTKIKIVFPLYE